MAYEISYSPQENHRYPIFRPRKKLLKWLLGVALAAVTALAIPQVRRQIGQALLPGDNETTREAVTAFVEDVRQGVSIPDAFQAFCREIVKDVEVPKTAD